MDQIGPTDTFQPFPPITIREDVLKAALPMWIQKIQNEQTDTPYGIIDSSIPAIIFALLQRKRREIHSAFYMKGGWEGWFQVELALCLEGHGYTVEREQHVFNAPLEAADLVVTSPHGICTIIELKCEGMYQDITDVQLAAPTTRAKFAVRIDADVEKFGAGGGKIRDEYCGIFFCCVGVSGTMGSTEEAISHLSSVNGCRPWFDGLSLDRIAQYAVENGLMTDDSIDERPVDDLVMWWSGVHQKI
ncbi:hypothetical protein W97_06758 [Coniosporium apollinis CBS 100218]|uniref:Uncharacterized protein n=1 Tax=Coniosporium apollinis (strain CBS 100218) TaxID=1168221 RepID=R7Z0B2_CONA1|nr:uncharacterized protein W97_06758 [Coniosporium apollinis CBS 100218]EON67615.1 hypothetical protein W97_06758 [Coniosporium apollinis CBS 100218]